MSLLPHSFFSETVKQQICVISGLVWFWVISWNIYCPVSEAKITRQKNLKRHVGGIKLHGSVVHVDPTQLLCHAEQEIDAVGHWVVGNFSRQTDHVGLAIRSSRPPNWSDADYKTCTSLLRKPLLYGLYCTTGDFLSGTCWTCQYWRLHTVVWL